MSFSTNFSNLNPFNGTSPDSIGIPSNFLNTNTEDDGSDALFGSSGLGGVDLPDVGSSTGIGQNARAEIFKRIYDKINSQPNPEVAESLKQIQLKQAIPQKELPQVAAQVYEAASLLIKDLQKSNYSDETKNARLKELLKANTDLVTEYGSTDSLVWVSLLFDELPYGTTSQGIPQNSSYDYLYSLLKEWGVTEQFNLGGKAASQKELSPEEKQRVTRILQDQLRVSIGSFLEHPGAIELTQFYGTSEYMSEAQAYMNTFQRNPSGAEDVSEAAPAA